MKRMPINRKKNHLQKYDSFVEKTTFTKKNITRLSRKKLNVRKTCQTY